MKKIKLLLSILLIFTFITPNVFAEDNEDVLKQKLLSYGMYSELNDNETNIKTQSDISNLTYKEIKAIVRNQIVEKMNEFEKGNLLWDPAFVLELVPNEFPEFAGELRTQLYAQGYDPKANIVGTIEIENSSMTRATTYTKRLSYSYSATGHGTVITCDNTISWSMDDSKFVISSVKAEFTGGWGGIDKTSSIRNNKTSSAYGFYSYTANKDAYSYSAYLQLKVTPSSSGNATLSVLSSGVNAIGIGF
ncbi:hypothetical protein [Anaerorhabdus furcosa]|uniref:Uncharacterized protein n=1 Tax=Anaerorhabdus furcosa TaxID=118967 RepID=A0A1T4Q4W4_9FIRM|nr:hypothetical protein [Anaerorhabdus furcosa]SJZ98810.1 hypothetical protein SAMN02745191_2319 [Anaerorhabdus furcosa]